MNCERCRGACCETFMIPASDIDVPGDDASRWLALHATPRGRQLEFECRCTKLTAEGRCGIYADRPSLCQIFPVGGPDCLDAVRSRRTPEQYTVIRDPDDPERIHVRESTPSPAAVLCVECGQSIAQVCVLTTSAVWMPVTNLALCFDCWFGTTGEVIVGQERIHGRHV